MTDVAKSDQYTGPERRQRDEWQIAIERRLDTVEKLVDTNTQSTLHTENVVADLKAGQQETKGTVHTIKHDLANNTLLTQGTAASVRMLRAEVVAVKGEIAEVKGGNDTIITLLNGFTALDRAARAVARLWRPIGVLVTAWLAFKAWWR